MIAVQGERFVGERAPLSMLTVLSAPCFAVLYCIVLYCTVPHCSPTDLEDELADLGPEGGADRDRAAAREDRRNRFDDEHFADDARCAPNQLRVTCM